MPPTGTVTKHVLILFTIFFAAATCGAQQEYVGRYNIYTGFSDLSSPGLNGLNQVGFNLQAGANVNRWLAGGFDYSAQSGDTALTAILATQQLQTQLTALAIQFVQAGFIPPGYTLTIPTRIHTDGDRRRAARVPALLTHNAVHSAIT